jgi:CheY-like chemotaxis protein
MESRWTHPLIAIIDDDAPIVDWAFDLLTDASYRVISAPNRDTAFDRLRQQRPDVMLVDLHMDYRDEGWVLLDLVQATPALASIPVILWSADTQALHAQARRITARGWQWLAKPCTPAQVLAAIEQSRAAGAPSAG